MKTKIIPSRWLADSGRRLDPGPYLSGAIEAKETLRALRVKKDALSEVTKGFNGGIFNGPQFSRNYVESAEHGVPFLGSSSMLLADLEHLPLLRKRDAESSKLRHLCIEEGMTLISCSGTIGRMVFARPDMARIWSSQHIMKVAPDTDKIPSGYLYAFLSSRFGVPMVTSGTYGAIIQHIEPEHIRELPVPRLDDQIELNVARLIEDAAKRRSRASHSRRAMSRELAEMLDWHASSDRGGPSYVSSRQLAKRMDAFYYSGEVVKARVALKRHRGRPLGETVVSIFEPNRFKRIPLTDKAYGVPFFSSSDVFMADPVPQYTIPKKLVAGDLTVGANDVLVPRSGQLGGIIGRALLPIGDVPGGAASEDLIRIRMQKNADALLLWAVLSSQPGYFAMIGSAFGSSIPHLNCGNLREIEVPQFRDEVVAAIVTKAASILSDLNLAIEAERDAIRLVETAISERA